MDLKEFFKEVTKIVLEPFEKLDLYSKKVVVWSTVFFMFVMVLEGNLQKALKGLGKYIVENDKLCLLFLIVVFFYVITFSFLFLDYISKLKNKLRNR